MAIFAVKCDNIVYYRGYRLLQEVSLLTKCQEVLKCEKLLWNYRLGKGVQKKNKIVKIEQWHVKTRINTYVMKDLHCCRNHTASLQISAILSSVERSWPCRNSWVNVSATSLIYVKRWEKGGDVETEKRKREKNFFPGSKNHHWKLHASITSRISGSEVDHASLVYFFVFIFYCWSSQVKKLIQWYINIGLTSRR